jgi:hypothetical protein
VDHPAQVLYSIDEEPEAQRDGVAPFTDTELVTVRESHYFYPRALPQRPVKWVLLPLPVREPEPEEVKNFI